MKKIKVQTKTARYRVPTLKRIGKICDLTRTGMTTDGQGGYIGA